MPLTAASTIDALLGAARFYSDAAIVAKGCEDRAYDQQGQQDLVQQAAFVLLDRIAYPAMNALAQIRGQRLLAQSTTG